MQRQILEVVPLEGSISLDRVRWELADAADAVEPNEEGQAIIRKAFEQSFDRAVGSLIRSGRLVREDAKLVSIDELVDMYPFKTRYQERRRLREQLLPHLAEFLRKRVSAYDFTETERFVEPTPEAPEIWKALDAKLRAFDADATAEESELLFSIRAKGRELFTKAKVTIKPPLRGLIRRAETVLVSPGGAALVKEMKDAYRGCFDSRDMEHAVLKAKLHTAANLKSGNKIRLHDVAKDFLEKVAPEVIRAMPNYDPVKDPDDEEHHLMGFGSWQRHKNRFDPLLDKLIDRDVYREFAVLRRPAAA